ncbi:outer membrane beta-barrel protein [Chryseobacterium formosus]|uniref:Outer membrane beta-barrel protein n=1 Tax=Chryseobacterium formosus TaxID=1537363 RepID=A0ABT3XXL7_9FLAO|nr:outer membrane beta-barrel protein [Chryseobacterium formosus]MCX8526393.1 outer membrane beta-barrel protein [Chryseobacterium formosus]
MEKIISKLILLLSIVVSTVAFSQNSFKIEGRVLANEQPLSDVIISIPGNNTKVLTNKEGKFSIIIQSSQNKNVEIIFSAVGYNENRQIFPLENNSNIQVILKEKINEIAEVAIDGKTTLEKAGKTSYKINSKDFTKNTKSDKVLQRLPSITVVNENVLIHNRKQALLFIDGIEADFIELKKLDAKDVATVEVISNPPSMYNSSQNVDAIIQIITKVKEEHFIKGELEARGGTRLSKYGFSPTLSYKSKNIIFKAFYDFGTNNQNINNDFERIDGNFSTYTKTDRKVKGWQNSLNAKSKIILNSKSSIYLSGNLFGYHFDGKSKGVFTDSNQNYAFLTEDQEVLRKWGVSGVYEYKFNDKAIIQFRSKYYNHYNSNNYLFQNSLSEDHNTSYARLSELSNEVIYRNKSKIQGLTYFIGYKNINRRFQFPLAASLYSQSLNTFHGNFTYDITDKISTAASLAYDNTYNSTEEFSQNYSYFLPSASVNFDLGKMSLNVDYSYKIQRPNSTYLNPVPVVLSPTYTLKGNNSLLPELKHSFDITLHQKNTKNKSDISLNLFSQLLTNATVETLVTENNLIINSFENAGKGTIIGSNLSYNRKLFKLINFSGSVGFNYSLYKTHSEAAIIRRNEGFSLSSNINLSTTIKDKYVIIFNGNYNSRNIQLVSTSYYRPLTSIELESNYFNDNLTVNLSYNDLFGWSAKSKIRSDYKNFSQTNLINNNLSNILLTITYRFGKNFTDRFSAPTIVNDDITNK